MKPTEDLLRQVPLFSSLESAEIAYLAERCRVQTLPPDTIFIHEDEPGDSMYVIGAGEVDVIKALGTPEESLLAVYRTGELVGEMSLLNPDQPRSASARSRGEVMLVIVTREDIEALLPRFPNVAMDFLRILSQRLYSTASVKIRDLTVKNQELNAAYEDLKAAQAQLVQQKVLEQELAHAQRIQEQMLPRVLPRLDGVDIGATMIPARMVGGDLYDVFRLDEDRLGVAVGDVSGKGIPAALYMALVCSLLRATVPMALTPSGVLDLINTHLCERDMDSMFVTLVYGELDLRSLQFDYALAGHDRPLVWHSAEGLLPQSRPRSRPLGLIEPSLLISDRVALRPGSRLLLFSDGATDAMNDSGSPFGRPQLERVFGDQVAQSAQHLCDSVVAAVNEHQADAQQFDDITLLTVRIDDSA